MKTQKILITLITALLISLLSPACNAQKSTNLSFEYRFEQAKNLMVSITSPEAGMIAIYLSPATSGADMAVEEDALKLEKWMTNTATFTSELKENYSAAFDKATEEDMELEDWMTRSFEIKGTLESALAPAPEEKLELENWMCDPSYWIN